MASSPMKNHWRIYCMECFCVVHHHSTFLWDRTDKILLHWYVNTNVCEDLELRFIKISNLTLENTSGDWFPNFSIDSFILFLTITVSVMCCNSNYQIESTFNWIIIDRLQFFCIFDVGLLCMSLHCPWTTCFPIFPLLVLKQEVPLTDPSV